MPTRPPARVLAAAAILAAICTSFAWLDPLAADGAYASALRTVGAGLVLALLGQRRVLVHGRTLIGAGGLACVGIILLVVYQEAMFPAQTMLAGLYWLSMAALVLAAAALTAEAAWLALGAALVGSLVVAGDLAIEVLRHGTPDEQLAGLVGYRNAAAACAGVALISGAWLLAHARRLLQILGTLLVLVGSLAGVATVSRGALLAAAIGGIVGLFFAAPPIRARLAAGLVGAATVQAAALMVAGSMAGRMALILFAGGLVLLIPSGAAVAARVAARVESTTLASSRRRRVTGGVLVLVVIVTAGIAGPSLWSSFTQGEVASKAESERLLSVGSNARWSWWTEATREWKTAPLLGHGAGAFTLRRQADPEAFRYAQRPHSAPLQGLVELGLIGTLVLGASLVLIVRPRRGMVGSGVGPALAVATVLGAQSLSDWTLATPLLGTTFIATLGVIGSWSPSGQSTSGNNASDMGSGAATSVGDPHHGAAWVILAPFVLLAPTVAPAWAYVQIDRAEAAFVDGTSKPGNAAALKRAERHAASAWRIIPDSRAMELRVTSLSILGKNERAEDILASSLPLVKHERAAWQVEYDMALAAGDEKRANAANVRYQQLQKWRKYL